MRVLVSNDNIFFDYYDSRTDMFFFHNSEGQRMGFDSLKFVVKKTNKVFHMKNGKIECKFAPVSEEELKSYLKLTTRLRSSETS